MLGRQWQPHSLRSHWVLGTLLVLVPTVSLTACQQRPVSQPERHIGLLVGAFSEPWENLAAFADAEIGKVRITVEPSHPQSEIVSVVQEQPNEIGVAASDVVYPAYQRGLPPHLYPHNKLRGIAVVGTGKVYIVVRRDSPIRAIGDLRGKRVAVGSGAARRVAHIILQSYGLDDADVRLASPRVEDMAADVARGNVDVAIIPLAIDMFSPLHRSHELRALPVDRHATNNLVSEYSFVRPMIISPGELPAQQEMVETVGSNALLICHEDLDEQFVYDLTRVVHEWLSYPVTALEQGRSVTPDAALATPIPLHPGAARFYREREIFQ